MEIISRKNGAALANLSQRTMDRLHVEGSGPPRIQLTRHRCGYEREQFEAWLRSRAFNSRAEAMAAGAANPAPAPKTDAQTTDPSPQRRKRKRSAARK